MLGLLEAYSELLLTPKQRARRDQCRAKERARRMAAAEPWHPKMHWAPELNLHGDGYELMPPLFDVPPTKHGRVKDAIAAGEAVLSPTGSWAYSKWILPAGKILSTAYSNKRGTVVFDTDVAIPRINRYSCIIEAWDNAPWMSLTPMEHFTLRGGVRWTKGDVVMGGLGMGYQLWQVARKKTVKHVRVVEVSQDLADWIWPRLMEILGPDADKCELVVGDAREVIPRLKGDVLLMDIWPSYGGNCWPEVGMANGRDFKRVWCWGSQYLH